MRFPVTNRPVHPAKVSLLICLCLTSCVGLSSPPVNGPGQIAENYVLGVVALNIILDQDGEEMVFVASGFLISDELIVTSRHALTKGAKEVWALWDHAQHRDPIRVEAVAETVDHDLALLKLSRKLPISPLPLADPADVSRGETIAILGFPESTQSSDVAVKHLHVFRGHIAALQEYEGTSRLVLDAKVLQGNSGGPVVQMSSGRVVGVVSEIVIDSDEEEQDSNIISVEGESVGIAVSSRHLKELLHRYRQN